MLALTLRCPMNDPIDNPYDFDLPDPSPGLVPPSPIQREEERVYNEAYT